MKFLYTLVLKLKKEYDFLKGIVLIPLHLNPKKNLILTVYKNIRIDKFLIWDKYT